MVELTSIDPARELFITDVSVVDDSRYTGGPREGEHRARGGWSFGQLIDNMLPELLPQRRTGARSSSCAG